MRAPESSGPAATESATDENRARILEGLGQAIAEKGYVATTIADIVKHARLSKRTFYEHFADKEACFVASYEAVSTQMMQTVAAAVDPGRPWDEQIRAAARAYFNILEDNPTLARAFLLEVNAAGPRALTLRREIHERFATLLRGLVQSSRKQNPHIRPLSPEMATALVGGINELALVALEKGRGRNLRDLAATATELVQAVLAAPKG